MRLIGIEEHFTTPAVRDAWDAIRLGARDRGAACHDGDVGRRLLDLAEGRLALMDETGLDIQVLSLTTPARHDLGPESVELGQRADDAVAAVVTRHPTRFQALATLPVAMPKAAATELDRCIRTLSS